MLFSCWCLVYTTTNLKNLDTPEFVNGPVLCIIIQQGWPGRWQILYTFMIKVMHAHMALVKCSDLAFGNKGQTRACTGPSSIAERARMASMWLSRSTTPKVHNAGTPPHMATKGRQTRALKKIRGADGGNVAFKVHNAPPPHLATIFFKGTSDPARAFSVRMAAMWLSRSTTPPPTHLATIFFKGTSDPGFQRADGGHVKGGRRPHALGVQARHGLQLIVGHRMGLNVEHK